MADENQQKNEGGEIKKMPNLGFVYVPAIQSHFMHLRRHFGALLSGSAKLKKGAKMAFGIIRARNLSAGDISSTDKHNARKYDKMEDFPSNINPEGERHEYYLKPESDFLYKDETNLEEVIQARIKAQGVKGIKSNSNLAIEYVATINDKKAWENYPPSSFFSNTSRWLEERHGKGSVVAIYEHYDESNPHAHFVVVPIAEKAVKWKNSRGSGERIEKHLNTRDFTGGREKLRGLQDDYFKHLQERYGDTKLGVPIYRGTLVENQTRIYIEQTVAEIGKLRDKLSDITNEKDKLEVVRQILDKQEENALNELKLKNLENGKFKAGRNWENKGTGDNPSSDIFHGNENKEEKTGRRMRR